MPGSVASAGTQTYFIMIDVQFAAIENVDPAARGFI
jgi:hypothetical protein